MNMKMQIFMEKESIRVAYVYMTMTRIFCHGLLPLVFCRVEVVVLGVVVLLALAAKHVAGIISPGLPTCDPLLSAENRVPQDSVPGLERRARVGPGDARRVDAPIRETREPGLALL